MTNSNRSRTDDHESQRESAGDSSHELPRVGHDREPAGTVPNGSGRPAKTGDRALVDLVEGLFQQLGRLPTLDQIIEAAGGCQRSRAVAARRHVAQQIAQGTLEAQIQLPNAVELRHRKLLTEWLRLAREQIQPVLIQTVDDAQDKASAAELAAQDARGGMELAQARMAETLEEMQGLRKENDRLTQRVAQLSASEARWKARAEERAATIQHLSQTQAGGGK